MVTHRNPKANTERTSKSLIRRYHPQHGWEQHADRSKHTLVKVSRHSRLEKQKKVNNKTISFYITIQFNLLNPLTCLRDLHSSLPQEQRHLAEHNHGILLLEGTCSLAVILHGCRTALGSLSTGG